MKFTLLTASEEQGIFKRRADKNEKYYEEHPEWYDLAPSLYPAGRQASDLALLVGYVHQRCEDVSRVYFGKDPNKKDELARIQDYYGITSEGPKSFENHPRKEELTTVMVKTMSPHRNISLLFGIPMKDGSAATINAMGKKWICEETAAIVPVMRGVRSDKFGVSMKGREKWTNRFFYGAYPQTVVPDYYAESLERAFKSDSLVKTGNSYTFGYEKGKPTRTVKEFEYDNKRYVRVEVDPGRHSEILSDGKRIDHKKAYWVEVRPIEWIRQPDGVCYTDRALLSGISMMGPNGRYTSDLKQTDLGQFFENCFAHEMRQSYAFCMKDYFKNKEWWQTQYNYIKDWTLEDRGSLTHLDEKQEAIVPDASAKKDIKQILTEATPVSLEEKAKYLNDESASKRMKRESAVKAARKKGRKLSADEVMALRKEEELDRLKANKKFSKATWVALKKKQISK